MRISKRQLRRIIKEEKTKLLREEWTPRPAVDWMDEGTPEVEAFSEDAKKRLKALIDDLVAEAEAVGGELARKKVFKRIVDAAGNIDMHPDWIEWRTEG
jgi:SpoVK/Ycf46/Vps4 family AAA+-type ATPase